jgi:hypothetical protein
MGSGAQLMVEVSTELHVPAVLPSVTWSAQPVDRKQGRPQGQSGQCEEDINLFHLPGIDVLSRPFHTIITEQLLFVVFCSNKELIDRGALCTPIELMIPFCVLTEPCVNVLIMSVVSDKQQLLCPRLVCMHWPSAVLSFISLSVISSVNGISRM